MLVCSVEKKSIRLGICGGSPSKRQSLIEMKEAIRCPWVFRRAGGIFLKEDILKGY